MPSKFALKRKTRSGVPLKVLSVCLSVGLSAQAYAVPSYELTYGDWKQMCGQPNQACNFFLKGFLQSASFWTQWVEDAALLRPDLKRADDVVRWISMPQDNGQLCLPRNIQFESVRSHVDRSLELLYREQSDFTPGLSTLLTGPGLRVNLYDAFKNAYPCQSQ